MKLGFLIMSIVSLNVASGIILKTLADGAYNRVIIGLGFVTVLTFNALRLFVWMLANRRFPLSTTYPLTSFFFPIMLIVSFVYGDRVNPPQVVGTVLIASGVFWLGWRVPRSAPPSNQISVDA
jgi:drug/metabolite transporter (DMT)-like permease